MLQKMRLGKRSPLGALLSSTAPAEVPPGRGGGEDADVAMATGQQGGGGVRGQSTPLSPGGTHQPDLLQGHMLASSFSSCRSVSSCIDVPARQGSSDEADMDELMAAMVLSSLSCSPRLHSMEPQAPLVDCGGGAGGGGGGGELSDGGSSGYWSVGPCDGSPAPSPPTTGGAVSPATPPDEGLDMELDLVLFEEPVPRRRRNSVRTVFKCLWPGCSKVLTSVVGIKRHIRMTHLCVLSLSLPGPGLTPSPDLSDPSSRGGEHERCSRSEEDFYYTELSQWEPQPPPPVLHGPAPSPPSLSTSCSSSSSPPPSSPASASPPACRALSCSAPPAGSSWQVTVEHSYQAPPPGHVMSAAASCLRAAPSSACSRQDSSFRTRSVSVGEQWLQHQSAPCRRVRGEARKCRKVYGIEHREQWCTACRWKKACQRFLD